MDFDVVVKRIFKGFTRIIYQNMFWFEREKERERGLSLGDFNFIFRVYFFSEKSDY